MTSGPWRALGTGHWEALGTHWEALGDEGGGERTEMKQTEKTHAICHRPLKRPLSKNDHDDDDDNEQP